eukprot:6467430-Amphidinium_carterae.1
MSRLRRGASALDLAPPPGESSLRAAPLPWSVGSITLEQFLLPWHRACPCAGACLECSDLLRNAACVVLRL